MNETSDAGATPRLRRSTSDRMVAGVCGGIAASTGLDATLIRLAVVLLVLFGGTGVLAYLLAWALMPADDGRPSAAETLAARMRGNR